MPAADLQSYKVAAAELSSATKFNNLVQAVQDEFGDIDADQIPGYPSSAYPVLRGDGSWGPGAWTAYIPVWTASATNPTVGNTVFNCAWARVGKIVFVRIYIACGSTFAPGAGNYNFSVPFEPISTSACGGGWLYDLSATGMRVCIPEMAAGAKVLLRGENIVDVTAAVPWVWANGDVLNFSFFYETNAA